MKKQNLYALLASFIWGTAFVAQSMSADIVSPFAFNMSRSLIAAIALLILNVAIFSFKKKKHGYCMPKSEKKQALIGGVLCGTFLAIATALQQAGLSETSAGKAGFITALYIVIVPVLGIFLRKKVHVSIWISVIIAVAGLYFLCVKGSMSIKNSDVLVILCAFMFAIQILLIDHFVSKVDGIVLSFVQFVTTFVLSLIGMLVFEDFDINAIIECIFPILYVGIFSSAVAYTLQILAQKNSNPTVISLLLSLESVFSVIAGAVILGDKLSAREYIGCALMFAAVVLAQIPVSVFKKAKREPQL